MKPLVQVAGALLAMFGGAELVDLGHTCLGLTVLFTFLLLAVDGLFRNPRVPDDARDLVSSHQEVLQRAWRER